MTVVVIGFSAFFLSSLLLFVKAMRSIRREEIVAEDFSKSGISIIIAAKNEARNLDRLFHSLENQQYPKDKFEVVFVDDESTDDTFSVAQSWADHFENFTLIKAKNKLLPAKKGALEVGIAAAKFPFLLFTDADCQPQPDWLKSFSEKFSRKYDLVFGFAPFAFKPSFANHFFCFENFRTTMLTFTTAVFGLPYSAASRSLGIREEAFQKIGGFTNTLQTLGGDDDLLIREAVKNKFCIGIVSADESLVFSDTQENFRNYFKQKRRHTATSFHYLFKHKAALGIWHLLNILAVDSLFLLPFYHEAGYIFLSKILCDFLLVFSFQRKFEYKFSFGEIFFFQILYECLLVFNFFSARFFKISWK